MVWNQCPDSSEYAFVWGIAFFLVFRDDCSDGKKRKSLFELALEILISMPVVVCLNPFPIAAAYLGYLAYKLALGGLSDSWNWIFLGIAFALSLNLCGLRSGQNV